MTVQIELWALLTFFAGLLLSFLAGVFGIARFILGQMDKRLDERFQTQQDARKEELQRRSEQFNTIEGQLRAQEQAREAGKKHWDAQFAEIDRQLSDHRERIGRLEAVAESSPTHDDLGDLHERINAMAQDVSNLTGEFKGANRTLELIHAFLMNGGKG
jgi:chromosome segregation ATPase